MKKAPKTHILDRLHRGVVYTCIGLTAYGTYLLGHRLYRYYYVIKPNRLEEERKTEQKDTLDALVDRSPSLRT